MKLQNLIYNSHKIKKITIHNQNTYSLMSEIVVKITLNDVTSNDTIRFTYNDELLSHQSIDNDFFVRIPNILNKNFDIYAHYFASDLYEYDEDTEIFSIYDFQELYDFLKTGQKEGKAGQKSYYCYQCGYIDNEVQISNNVPMCNNCGSTNIFAYDDEYTIQIDYDNDQIYDYDIDETGRFTVQSKLKNSVNKYKDPNYKNYLSNDINKTQKGFFPLSSKYRTNTNTQAPNIDKNINALWETDNPKNHIFWEARINRRGLSPLISNGVEDGQGNIIKDIPLNVYLDYEYIPTSTEYHQHFYGFESALKDKEDPEYQKNFNVLEGAQLNTISTKFNSDNYKIINWGNPYDNSHTMFVNHDHIIPINFDDFIPATINNIQTCEWYKNICHNYWIYKPLNTSDLQNKKGYCSKIINNLKDDAWYSLKFYIFLPAYLHNNTSVNFDFDIQVISNYLSDDPIIYKIDDSFLEQDNVLKDQWIYHEIPFIATESVMIKIYGPNYINGLDNSIFFTNMLLQKMPRYTPTLKYTNRGLFVLDTDDETLQNKYVYKPVSEEVQTDVDDTESNILWNKIEEQKLPTPFSEVYISSNNNTNLYYDKETTTLYYEHLPFNNDPNDPPRLWIENNTEDDLPHLDLKTNDTSIINVIEDANHNKTLQMSYDDYITAVKGPSNRFIINFTDSNNNPLNEGNAIASICSMDKQLATLEDDTTLTLPRKNVESGTIIWNVNLSDLPINEPNEFYYLKIEYKNECSHKNKIEYIKFVVVEENLHIEVDVRGATKENNKYIIHSVDDFPLKITANIFNQIDLLNPLTDKGYCELSIDDKLNQTTLMDYNGECDFYLDLDDITCGEHTIKIEYYREYYKALCFYYFEIDVQECDARPCIPIEFKILSEGRTINIGDENYFECDYNDCILFDITTGKHSGFKLEVWKETSLIDENPKLMIQENINSVNKNDYTFVDSEDLIGEPKTEFANNNDLVYYYHVKTGNMTDSNGNIIDNRYRDNHRTLCVVKKASVDRYSNYSN